MKRFHDIFSHPHELVIHGGWRRALRHKVANSLYNVTETGQERCQGTPDEVFWGEQLSFGKPRHNIGEREGEADQVLLGWSGSQEGTKLAF